MSSQVKVESKMIWRLLAWASQQMTVAFSGMDEVERHPVLCARMHACTRGVSGRVLFHPSENLRRPINQGMKIMNFNLDTFSFRYLEGISSQVHNSQQLQ